MSNIQSPRGVGASTVLMEAAFKRGVDDFRRSRALAEADAIPPLEFCKDTAGNRCRIYELGRLTAAFSRTKRRKINRSLLLAAKREGIFP